jgi:hypothetical protein
MRNIGKILEVTSKIILVFGFYTNLEASEITTKNIVGTTSTTVISSIHVTANPALRFKIGSVNENSGSLNVSTTVDSTISSVTASASANQFFKDDSTKAKYYGYYISTGVTSANQTAKSIHIKIRKGPAETSGRSYYLVGNGSITPKKESDLTAAPVSYTTFATTTSNLTHCGKNYRANHLIDGINCGVGSTVENMDITQFVKVLDTDKNPSAIISQLEFTAIPE